MRQFFLKFLPASDSDGIGAPVFFTSSMSLPRRWSVYPWMAERLQPEQLASFEASLDVQQAGGMALGATIVLYSIPDLSDQCIFDAYQTIIETNTVDIVSSLFGGPEGVFTAACNGGRTSRAFWPASLPHVTAVGGTNLATSSIPGSCNPPTSRRAHSAIR